MSASTQNYFALILFRLAQMLSSHYVKCHSLLVMIEKYWHIPRFCDYPREEIIHGRAMKNIDERKGQWFVYWELSL